MASRGHAIGIGACLALVLVTASPAAGSPTRVRKDVAALTPAERRTFTDVVVALKHVASPYDPALNYYDQFVQWHRDLYRCTPGRPQMLGHGGPMFLPWHRDFILAFENALRDVSGKSITVPYWDWTSKASTRAMFKLMGGAGDPSNSYAVVNGPFRKGRFRIHVQPAGSEYATSHSAWITRNPGSIGPLHLPTSADVDAALRAPVYDVSPFDNRSDPAKSFRTAVEGFHDTPDTATTAAGCGKDHLLHATAKPADRLLHASMHNAVHPWVGGIFKTSTGAVALGTMMQNTSPNDPIFFLHHANIDRLWAIWQTRHPAQVYQPATGFPDNTKATVMKPFDRVGLPDTPQAVERISRLGYTYDDLGNARTGRSSANREYICRFAR